MELAELRRQIVREITQARAAAAERRRGGGAAQASYDTFIDTVAGPLVKQTVQILRAERLPYQAQTPAGSARIASDTSADDFIEFVLDTSTRPPRVMGRLSITVGRHDVVVDEVPIAPDKPIADLQETDLLPFLIPAIGRLAAR